MNKLYYMTLKIEVKDYSEFLIVATGFDSALRKIETFLNTNIPTYYVDEFLEVETKSKEYDLTHKGVVEAK